VKCAFAGHLRAMDPSLAGVHLPAGLGGAEGFEGRRQVHTTTGPTDLDAVTAQASWCFRLPRQQETAVVRNQVNEKKSR
jgi:hypothetical protein